MRLYPHDDVTGEDDWDATHYQLTGKALVYLDSKGK